MARNNVPIDIVLRLRDRATRMIGRRMGRATRMIKSFGGTAVSVLGSVVKISSLVVAGVTAITTAFVVLLGKGLVPVAAQFERTEVMLRRLYGSFEGGRRALEGFKEFMAKGVPVSIEAAQDAFVKLKVSGLDPLNGSLQTLIDAVAAFGGGGVQLKRAAVAIQQMMSKGVASSEELRQQLSEAVPNAMQILARELGISMSALSDRLKKGSLSSKEAVTALFRGMQKDFSGASRELAETWGGLWNRIKVQISLFTDDIMRAGPFEALKTGLAEVLDKIEEWGKDGTLKRWARSTAQVIMDAFKLVADVIGKTLALFQKGRATYHEIRMAQSKVRFTRAETRTKEIAELMSGLKAIKPGEEVPIKDTGLFGQEVTRFMTFEQAQKTLKGLETEQKELLTEMEEYRKAHARHKELMGNATALVEDINKFFEDTQKALDAMKEAGPPEDLRRFAGLTEFTRREHAMGPPPAAAEGLIPFDMGNIAELRKMDELANKFALERALAQSEIDRQFAADRVAVHEEALREMGVLSSKYYAGQLTKINEHVASLRRAGENEVDIQRWAKQEENQLNQTYWQAQLESSTTFYDAMTARLQLFASETQNTWKRITGAIETAVRGMASAIGQAVADATERGGSFLKSLEKIGKAVVRNLIAALVEEAIMFVLQSFIKVKTAAAEFASRSAMNVSLAATTAGASFASGGPIAAGAAAAATAAAVSAVGAASYGAALATFGKMAGTEPAAGALPKAHGGKDFISREEPWLLDRGEGVVNASENTRVAMLNDRVEELMGQIVDLVAAVKGGRAAGEAPPINLRAEIHTNIDGVQAGKNILEHAISGAVSKGRTTFALKEN